MAYKERSTVEPGQFKETAGKLSEEEKMRDEIFDGLRGMMSFIEERDIGGEIDIPESLGKRAAVLGALERLVSWAKCYRLEQGIKADELLQAEQDAQMIEDIYNKVFDLMDKLSKEHEIELPEEVEYMFLNSAHNIVVDFSWNPDIIKAMINKAKEKLAGEEAVAHA